MTKFAATFNFSLPTTRTLVCKILSKQLISITIVVMYVLQAQYVFLAEFLLFHLQSPVEDLCLKDDESMEWIDHYPLEYATALIGLSAGKHPLF